MPDRRPVSATPIPMFRRDPEKPRSPVPRWAVVGILIILLAGFISEAQAFLMPVTLAFLLFFVFAPFRRLLGRVGIGPAGTAGIVTIGLIGVVVVLGYVISGPVSEVMANSDRVAVRLEQRFSEIRASIRPLEQAAAKLEEITGGDAAPDVKVLADGNGNAVVANDTGATEAAAAPPQPVGADGADSQVTVEVTADTTATPSTMDRITTLGPAIGGQVVFTLVLLFFMLSSGDLLYLKIVQSFDTMSEKKAAYSALRDIEEKLGSYLGAITLVNAGLGTAIGLAMWAWGMPSPVLWGVAGFVLNFIPYIGAIMGTIAGALVALFVFDGIWTPILVGLTFTALTTLEGQFVTPIFVSRRLQLNEVVVFLTVALWAWLWSILGMVVAVPMLVVLRVLSEHVPALEKFGNFLAGGKPPALDEDDPPAVHEAQQDESTDMAEARDIIDAGATAIGAAEADERAARVEPTPEAASAGDAAASTPVRDRQP